MTLSLGWMQHLAEFGDARGRAAPRRPVAVCGRRVEMDGLTDNRNRCGGLTLCSLLQL
jgi:hypothetical protein